MSIEELYRFYQKHPLITTDSRRVPEDSIFFALKGEQFDGNAFVEEALEKGAAWAVSDDRKYAGKEKVILVDHVLGSLQQLALYHRQHLNLPVLGLTGSNGKTTTKELMAAVLSGRYKVFATSGNLNNHIGVPLSLLSINKEHELAIIEMGANHGGEIAQLCRLAEPGYGLITNIGKAHLEGFGSLDGVFAAKTELYGYLKERKGTVLVNYRDPLLREKARKEGLEVLWYGEIPPGTCSARIISADPLLKVEVAVLEGDVLSSCRIDTQMAGTYNVQNILAAVAAGIAFRLPFHRIKRAIEQYKPHNQRSQWIRTDRNRIYLDAYNANPTSMDEAIRSFMGIQSERKTLILGDMLELGDYEEEEHRKVLALIPEVKAERVLLVGPRFHQVARKHKDVLCFRDVEAAKKWLQENSFQDNSILIKGSRKTGMEQLIDML